MILLFSPSQLDAALFNFTVTTDMQNYAGSNNYDTSEYFRGACDSIAKIGAGAFMIFPGDLDPPENANWTIQKYNGKSCPWYTVVRNHEAETAMDMTWFREYNKNRNSFPQIVNIGSNGCRETTYSFLRN